MSSLIDYITVDEWKTLSDTPVIIGMAMVRAADSGIFGSLKEVAMLGFNLKQEMDKFPENEILRRVIEHIAPVKESGYWDFLEGKDIPAMALEHCRSSSDILGRKASEQQASEYKQAVLRFGEATAKSATEGGFLGFGGERYSAEEKALLGQVAEALGVSGWSPEAT